MLSSEGTHRAEAELPLMRSKAAPRWSTRVSREEPARPLLMARQSGMFSTSCKRRRQNPFWPRN